VSVLIQSIISLILSRDFYLDVEVGQTSVAPGNVREITDEIFSLDAVKTSGLSPGNVSSTEKRHERSGRCTLKTKYGVWGNFV